MLCLNLRCNGTRRRPLTSGEPLPDTLQVQLHGAELARSFAKVGPMAPYAVVSVDDVEVFRTPIARGGNRTPTWNAVGILRTETVPSILVVSVRSKNRLGRDVLCGKASLSQDVFFSDLSQVRLWKQGENTGTLRLKLSLPTRPLQRTAEVERTPRSMRSITSIASSHLVRWVAEAASLASSPSCRSVLKDEDDGPPTLLSTRSRGSATPKASSAGHSPSSVEVETLDRELALYEPLLGSWTCVATEGLDEFLKTTGISAIQRKLAAAAKWPSWDFGLQDGHLVYINHSAMGQLVEEIPLDGSAYQHKDGRGNLMTSTATWERTEDGGVLMHSRQGIHGTHKEERRVKGETLEFVLTNNAGVSWGRTFKRSRPGV